MKIKRIDPRLKIHKKDFWIYFFVFLFRISLDFIYIYFVNAKYEYYHFDLSYNTDYLFLSFFYLLVFIIPLPVLIRNGKLSDLTAVFLILLYFIPYTTILCYCHQNLSYALFVFLYYILFIYFTLIISIDQTKISQLDKDFGNSKLFLVVIILSGVLTILISGIYTGFRISFDLSEYYEYRAEAREYTMPQIVKYLSSWARVALMVGLVYSVTKKKNILTIFIIICTFFAFSFNGKKSTFFIMFLAIVVGFFYKNSYKDKIPFVFFGMNFMAIVEMFLRNGESFIAKHFVRRMLLIPPRMGTLYYDYFSVHELDYLRSSVLRRFGFTSPYGHIPRFIGQVFFYNDRLAMNANTGLCGDAYANFGFLSLLFVPFFISITFKIVERASIYNSEKMKVLVAFWLAYCFVSGAYFTLLLTNGVIFICVLLRFLDSSLQEENLYDVPIKKFKNKKAIL